MRLLQQKCPGAQHVLELQHEYPALQQPPKQQMLGQQLALPQQGASAAHPRQARLSRECPAALACCV